MSKCYTIQEISNMFNVPSSTIRYYEKSGLLTNIERNKSGNRVFTEEHISRIKTIYCFKNTGMTISQIKEFFCYENEMFEHIDDILFILENQKRHILDSIEELQKNYDNVQRKLCYYKDKKKDFECNKQSF